MLAGLSIGWIVAGAAAIGLPLIAHLLSRRGGRTVVYPAVRFVMRAAAEHARRHRLRDLLLFLMRAGAVVLIALAFDRPVWLTRAEGRSGATDGRDVVIVLDGSASMTRRERGRELYGIARDRAITVLEGLDWSRDRAAVVFVRRHAVAALPRLSGNRSVLIERVRESAVTLEQGDLAGALALARQLPQALDIDEESVRERRVVVIGDRQRSQWEGVDAPIGAEVEYSGVGPTGSTANLAVTELSTTPRRVLAGLEMVVTATVGNFGESARAPRVVLRESGGRVLGASTPTIAPNTRATVNFSVAFREVGLRRLEAVLIDTGFTADDIGRAVVEVVGGRRVALVTRAGSDDMTSAAYFFEAALAPNTQAPYSVIRIHPQDLNSTSLDGIEVVVVGEVGMVPGTGVSALARFVHAGGGVLWVADSGESGAALSEVAEGALAPESGAYEKTGQLLTIPGGAGMVDLRFGEGAGQEMEVLAGPVESSLRTVRFSSVCPVVVSSSARVRASLDSGEALVVDAPVGAGRIVSLHSALDPHRSTLVKNPVFPVLVGEIVGMLAGRDRDTGHARIGEAITIELFGAGDGVWSDDRGEPARVIDDGAGRVRVSVDPVAEARFIEVSDGGGRILGVASVGVDGRESDMRAMSDGEISAILTGEALAGVGSGRGSSLLMDRRRPVELWGWLMAGALLLLGAETLVSVSRRRASGQELRRLEGDA